MSCSDLSADALAGLRRTLHGLHRAGVGSRIGHLSHRLPQHRGAMSPLRRRGHGAARRLHGCVDVLGRDVPLLPLQHVNHSHALDHERGRHVRRHLRDLPSDLQAAGRRVALPRRWL